MLLAMTQDFVRGIIDGEGGRIYFPNSGLFKDGIKIDNVMFTIPGINLEIYWYGFLIALGMVLAMIYAYKNMRKFGLEPDRVTDTILAGFIGGIIGARAYYVIFSLDRYLTDEGTFDLKAALAVRRRTCYIRRSYRRAFVRSYHGEDTQGQASADARPCGNGLFNRSVSG